MILAFSDSHIGFRGYSILDKNGVASAEHDVRCALELVYTRASQDDVDMLIFCGDFFHNHRPTSENIRWAIYWFSKINTLGKSFYIIPGNHDTSEISHSLVFLLELQLENIFLIETPTNIFYKNIQLKFIPFMPGGSAKNKYQPIQTELQFTFTNEVSKDLIVISHFHEYLSKVGAESRQVAKSAESVSLSEITSTKTLFLLGHMHLPQTYSINNSIVCYPGSLINMDTDDCGIMKGMVLIDSDLSIKFEPLIGIRTFFMYTFEESQDILEFFKKTRLSSNRVIFIKIPSTYFIDAEELTKILFDRGCTLGKILYYDNTSIPQNSTEFSGTASVLSKENMLYNHLKETVSDSIPEWESTLYPTGLTYLTSEDI